MMSLLDVIQITPVRLNRHSNKNARKLIATRKRINRLIAISDRSQRFYATPQIGGLWRRTSRRRRLVADQAAEDLVRIGLAEEIGVRGQESGDKVEERVALHGCWILQTSRRIEYSV